ncbi:hypothetical protein G7Y89_g879 [Cudoniella acicularis]|uniref:Uncharacterized protein n=1 Tax=Cudoniella acicularis TaxID=354080 RepID=A0A8H4W7X9_9HELO|nr:hypothetical protein G7Y89_g879 [Cudoniella acicularis]
MAHPSVPAHWGVNFTPTIHHSVVPSTDPSSVILKSPFAVLITGSGKGIGEYIAYAYAKAGASTIIISSRTLSDLQVVSENIKKISPSTTVLAIQCDVASEASVVDLVNRVEKEVGRLDVLVNNAGTMEKLVKGKDGTVDYPKGLLEGTAEDFKRVYDVNFFGTYYMMRLVKVSFPKVGLRLVADKGEATTTSLTPLAYNLTKSAVLRLADHIHTAYHKDGIVVYSMHPYTALLKDHPPHWDNLFKDDIDLCGGFCVWLTKERREWLSGRYMMCHWDVGELEAMKEDIVEHDKLKFTMDEGLSLDRLMYDAGFGCEFVTVGEWLCAANANVNRNHISDERTFSYTKSIVAHTGPRATIMARAAKMKMRQQLCKIIVMSRLSPSNAPTTNSDEGSRTQLNISRWRSGFVIEFFEDTRFRTYLGIFLVADEDNNLEGWQV